MEGFFLFSPAGEKKFRTMSGIWQTMTRRACVPDRELWGGFVSPASALAAAQQARRGKGGDAVSLEREPSQRAHSSSCQLPLSPICFGHAVKRGTSDLLFPLKKQTKSSLPGDGGTHGWCPQVRQMHFCLLFFCTVTEPISTQNSLERRKILHRSDIQRLLRCLL